MPRQTGKESRSRVENARGGRGLLGAISCLVILLAAAGCPKQPIRDVPVPTRRKAEVISILNSHADLTRTVRAKLSVKIQTAKMKRPEKCEGSLAAACPDRLRIRGRHDLLDYPPFDIGSDGRTWFVHSHYEEHNEIHLGPTHLLDEYYDPEVPLRPGDIVLALGVGRLTEKPPHRELLFTRHPGYYLITELVTNASGRYVAKRITIDPERVAITRLETYRPDGAIDMIADMTFDESAGGAGSIPASARIRLLRKDAFLLELKLHKRRTGVRLPRKVFRIPDTGKIPTVHLHDSR